MPAGDSPRDWQAAEARPESRRLQVDGSSAAAGGQFAEHRKAMAAPPSDALAGIGALLKPNKYSILKFVDLHPGGAAALSGQIHEDDRLVSVDDVVQTAVPRLVSCRRTRGAPARRKPQERNSRCRSHQRCVLCVRL